MGTVLEAAPPERLVMTFGAPGEQPATGPSRVTFTIEPYEDIVRLTVVHEQLADEAEYEAAAAGWPAVLANLKSLIETGERAAAGALGDARRAAGRRHGAQRPLKCNITFRTTRPGRDRP